MAGFLPWMFHLVLIFWLIRHNSCAKLSYANCSEVEAAEPSVIKGIPYKFFCNCSHIEDVNCTCYQSCSKLLEAGFEESGYYEIDPDGHETGVAGFLVFCDMCTTVELPGCISGYSSFRKSCYKLYTDLKDKHNASAECAKIKKGNHLVDITSQEEQDFVAHMLSDVGSSDAWLGLTASGHNQPLYWSDDSPLEYKAWTSNGRNDGSPCVKMNSNHNYKWADHDCSVQYRYVCEYEVVCQNKLGMEDTTIPDNFITASSEWQDPNDDNVYYRAHEGRLNGGMFWAAADESDPWINVEFCKTMRISGIITQGSTWFNYWVETLIVKYQTNDERDSWKQIDQVFYANTDASTPEIILFKETIEADVVRIRPILWKTRIGMRLEILGCELEPESIVNPQRPVCRGATIIDHEQTRSSDLLDKTKPGEVTVPITYKPSFEQISTLVAASDTCQQYIQYSHDSSVLDESDWPYFWWKSRQGRDTFGGLSSESESSQRKIYDCPNLERLGVEDGSISDSAITASTEWDKNHRAAQGRLNHKQPTDLGSDSWVAKADDSNPWIQVEFVELTWVSGVMLQGRGDGSQWVTTYSVQYQTDGPNWMLVVGETNEESIFTGNKDKNTIVTSMFPSRVLAKVVRIIPQTWHSDYIGLRFEVVGCRLDDCQISEQLGVEDGRIGDFAITASTELNHDHAATQGRLNYKQPTEVGSDAWLAKKDDPTPWIQVQFSQLTWVSGVMLQGRGDKDEWVTQYSVQYQRDGQNWMQVLNEINEEAIFPGNNDTNTIVTSTFLSRVLAKAVRILPQSSHSEYVGLRFDLLGCRPGCTTPNTNCNCDGLNSIWGKDAGYLTDRGQLPITALRYGGNDKSKYSIGPLVCNGKRSLPKRSCAELWSEGVRIDMEYEIDPDGPDGIGPPFTVFCNLSQAAPILRSCEELRLAGYTTNGYYDIDPDGPTNGELPFTVFCVINETDARTRIHHDSESKGRVIGYKDPGDFVLSPIYMAWSLEQMRNLIGVSARCFQDIKYHCYNSRLFKSNNATDAEAWWISGDNGKMVNWGGVPTDKFGCSCSQSEPNTCIDNKDACNCDDDNSTWREDGGSLTDKDTLPVMKVYLGNTESPRQGYHMLGPLICLGKNDTYPLYRTCAELVRVGHRRNGYYMLDSDGTNTAPYVAYCDMDNNGVTILTHNYSSSIDMKSPLDIVAPVNYAATTNQLKALASLSGSCRQHLNFSCKQFPIWGTGLHLSWNSVNGQKMNNWGGVPTKNYGCACMDNNECSSGKSCNCDKNDDTLRVDEGWITDKQVLPVTSLNAKGTENEDSVGIVMLGAFACEGSDLPPPLRSCDEYMNAGFGNGWYHIDPDGPEGNLAAIIVNCDKGKTVIHHDSEERRLATGNDDTSDSSQTVKRVVKYRATMEQIQALIDVSQSCRQFIKWECHSSTIEDSNWVSGVDNEMHPVCSCGSGDAYDEQNEQCNCLKNDAVWRSDEGYLSDKSQLPVSKLVIGDIDGVDEFVYYTLGPLECFKKNQFVSPSCHLLKLHGGYAKNGYYDIDPDGSGTGVEPFAVYCDMTDGSTIIGHNREEKTLVRDTMKEDIDIEYTATLDQIQALIDISSHCQQYSSYECHKSGLFGSDLEHVAFWKHATADDKQYNFGGVDMGLLGCPCGFDGSCGNKSICNCESENKLGEWKSDSGFITNRNQLPVVFMRFGDTNANKQKGFYTLGKLQCSNKVFASCAELRDSGYLTDGYYPINSELHFCKMTPQGVCPVYRTGPNFLYQYRFPEIPDHVSSFEFSVDAQSDVYIALSTQPTQPTGLMSNSDDMYQIEIKPGRVDQVRLKICLPICSSKDPHDVPNLLNDAGLTHFYINWTDGLIEVGHKGKAPILSYPDPSPIQQIKYVGFSSGFDKEAEWRFHEYLCNGFRKLELRANIFCILIMRLLFLISDKSKFVFIVSSKQQSIHNI